MRWYLPLILSNLLIFPYSSRCQEYSYTHYDVKDGLAGSTAYCLTQDKEGFIWVGTETGVSRFDGTHFVNFTSADGLPDTEVLQMFSDSKGRVWMAPFCSAVCYYYKGKIHNQENDSTLRRVRSTGGIEGFAEDRNGDILMQEQQTLHLLTSDGRVIDYKDINGAPVERLYAIGAGEANGFKVMADMECYLLQDGHFRPLMSTPHKDLTTVSVALNKSLIIWKNSKGEITIKQFPANKLLQRYFDYRNYDHITFAVTGDSLVYDCRSTGAWELNVFTGDERVYLPGVQVSRLFRDNEGDLWFTTLGKGIYRLNSDEIRNLTLRDIHGHACAVVSLNKANSELLIGADHDMVFQYRLPAGPVAGEKIYRFRYGFYSYVDKTPNGYMISGGFDHIMLTKQGQSKYGINQIQLKMAVRKSAWELIIGNARGVFTFDLGNFRIKDTLWRERPTALYLQNDTLYIGSLKGLYRRMAGGVMEFLGDSTPFLRKRISAITGSPDKGIWVASYDAGLIKWKNEHEQVRLTMKQGLSSDICRAVLVQGEVLWVGTDKGLNKVGLTAGEYTVTRYTAGDGLASDMINTLFADRSRIFVGTPEGLSYFDADNTSLTARCNLSMLGITSAGRNRLSDSLSLRLPYKENNIRFDFAGISYRSAGNIIYHYRLAGLDSTWKTTKETFLEYPTLPAGDYVLQLRATNKFNVQSRMVSVPFSVETPYWRTFWFDAVVLLFFLLLTWLFVHFRIKHFRQRQMQERELHKRLAETEHMALQAQMNPHFIFNCLNSIQQYIFDQDVRMANKYIAGFAKLIRGTLHNSSKPFISLAEEITYLSTYLSLEKLRFKEKMDYAIDIEPDLRGVIEEIHIPPMLIQPYIENSMRHGLRHKTQGGGYIRINVIQEEGKLAFVIEDNGIGREQAARYKTREHIEYQSKGMSLTADRIRLINTVNGEGIQVEILDLKDPQGNPSGTRVTVRFPRYDLGIHSE